MAAGYLTTCVHGILAVCLLGEGVPKVRQLALLLLARAVCLLIIGCGPASQRSGNSSSSQDAQVRELARSVLEREGPPAGQAVAIEHVKATVPGCVIHGARTLRRTTDGFIVAVDMTLPASHPATARVPLKATESRRRNVNVLLRSFTSPEGTNYWRAETPTPEYLRSEREPVAKSRPDPYSEALSRLAEEADQSPSGAAGAREAAIETARATVPDCVIHGTASTRFGRAVYLVAVDVSVVASSAPAIQMPHPPVESSRRTLNMIVRQFTSQAGGTYWKAEPLTPDLAQLVLE